MWLFTKYGFYSASCARKGDGSYGNGVDPDTIMIRSRLKDHLLNLKARFKQIDSIEIHEDESVDYRFRLFVPKMIWQAILCDLAGEMDYDKFKPEVIKYSDENDQSAEYYESCLDVWRVMYDLQLANLNKA